jgi:glycerophosphoryl diester phosphodiesterase
MWNAGTRPEQQVEFDLQGHRGARGLAPENSLEAFKLAMSLGVTTLELDTAVTRDGVVVVAHDRRLNPDITRGQDGRWLSPPTPAVHDLTFSELQSYDVGRIDPKSAYFRRFPVQKALDGLRMPSLEDVFKLAADSGVRFNIETKLSPLAPDEAPSPEEFVEALLAVVHEAGMASRVTVQSFDWRTLQLMSAGDGEVGISYLTAREYIGAHSPWTASFDPCDYVSVPQLVGVAAGSRKATWSPDFHDLTRESTQEALSLSLKVLPWTVNEKADMDRLINWGVTGLITDYPDRAREALTAQGWNPQVVFRSAK